MVGVVLPVDSADGLPYGAEPLAATGCAAYHEAGT